MTQSQCVMCMEMSNHTHGLYCTVIRKATKNDLLKLLAVCQLLCKISIVFLLVFICFMHYPSFAYHFSSQIILLGNIVFYTKYCLLSYSIDVVATLSYYATLRGSRSGYGIVVFFRYCVLGFHSLLLYCPSISFEYPYPAGKSSPTGGSTCLLLTFTSAQTPAAYT